MMTIPGLALFYGGLVRAKNFLSVLIQCGAITAVTSVLWIAVGYSLAFSASGGSYIGNAQNFMFTNMFAMRDGQTIGELVFGLFQMTFAIITPGSDRRRLGRASALWLGCRIQRALVAARLCTGRALGLG